MQCKDIDGMESVRLTHLDELVRSGRRQALSRFSWERTARQVLEIYKEAAAEGK